MTPGVSVIICCYNSAPRLAVTIQHLLNQQVAGMVSWEIIIVDNASVDHTYDLAFNLLNNGDISYQVVREPNPGLSFARKKGYDTANYEFLLYCDDDNWLQENYVQLAYSTMMSDSKIGILGGLGEAVFEITAPAWFKQYEINFAVGDQSKSKEPLSRVSEVYGAGFTVRKSYLDKLFSNGFKSILSDRKGDLLISGGDTELCYLTRYYGFEVWYHRDLKFKHLMTKPRLSWNYIKKLYDGHGRTNIYTQAYKYFEKHTTLPHQSLRLPFWLDTFIHKVKAILNFYPKVMRKRNKEGDKDVLRFIAMKAEAREIWRLKEKYTELYQTLHQFLTGI